MLVRRTRARKGQGVSTWVFKGTNLSFAVIVAFIILGIILMLIPQSRQLACSMVNRLASAGLKFLIDPGTFGC